MLAGLASLRGLPDFEHAASVDSAHEKLQAAAVGFEGLEAVMSITLRSAEENEAHATLVRAIRERQVVELKYYSASSDAVSDAAGRAHSALGECRPPVPARLLHPQ